MVVPIITAIGWYCYCPFAWCYPLTQGSQSELGLIIDCDLLFFRWRACWGTAAAQGDDPLVKCVHYLVSELICDILGRRVSPVLEEPAVTKSASSQNA